MAVMDLGKVVPEKGTDYFTESDINEIVADVKSEITIPTKTSQLTNDSGYIDKTVNDLTYYELKTNTGSTIALSIDSSTYVMTMSLKNSAGTILNTQTVDLPLETMVVSGSYDSTNKKIVLTLKNGSTIDVPVGDLVSGLQSEITSQSKLSSDLVDDTDKTNKFVTASEKTTWNGKQDALTAGTNITIQNNVISATGGDLSNYLAKDNTTSYTPSGDYNPATKKYVDDNAGGGSDLPIYVLEISKNLTDSGIDITSTTDKASAGAVINEIYNSDKNYGVIILRSTSQWYEKTYIMTMKDAVVTTRTQFEFFTCASANLGGNGVNIFYIWKRLVITGSWSNGVFTCSRLNWDVSDSLDRSQILFKDNVYSYTPTNDYNPATKKYVDDSITTAITSALGGNY